jgi:hypothetical protein
LLLTLSFALSAGVECPLLLLLSLSLSPFKGGGIRLEQQQRAGLGRTHDVRDDTSEIYALRGICEWIHQLRGG